MLLDLARYGRRDVGGLAGRIIATSSPANPVNANQLSNHLGRLKDLGLLLCKRKGKEKWYGAVPDRVGYQRQEKGPFTLTLAGRGGALVVTVMVPILNPSNALGAT
jgi:hypothetical protein